MSDFTDFLTSLRGWTGFLDTETHTDALLTSWLRMGEQRINDELRCGEQLSVETAILTEMRIQMPEDCLETDFVRIVDIGVLTFRARHEFYERYDRRGFYTTSGRFVIVGGSVPENALELHFFARVPEFVDDNTWLQTKFPYLYTEAALIYAHKHMKAPDDSENSEQNVARAISKINASYKMSIASGSKLNRRPKGLG